MLEEKSQTNMERSAAWKYVGYPGFAALMASSNDFFALRKFGTLNVRVLLKLQDEIVNKERELRRMDQFTMSTPDGQGGCGSFRLDAETPRDGLLDDIASLLEKYNERLLRFIQLQDRPLASPNQLRNLRMWHECYPNAVESLEKEFLDYESDLITTKIGHQTHFGKWMTFLGLINLTSSWGSSKSAGVTRYYDRNAWKSLGGFWLLFCTLISLFGPLWAMAFARTTVVRLSIVTSATVAFCLIVIFGTTLKPSHRITAVAGYFALAVLVLGLTPTWGMQSGSSHPTAVIYALPVTAQAPTTPRTSVDPTVTTGAVTTITPSPSLNFSAQFESYSKAITSKLVHLSEEAATETGAYGSSERARVSSLYQQWSSIEQSDGPSEWTVSSAWPSTLDMTITSSGTTATLDGTFTAVSSSAAPSVASSSAMPSTASGHASLSTANKIALGASLGVGLPSALVSLAAVIWLCFRRRAKIRIHPAFHHEIR